MRAHEYFFQFLITLVRSKGIRVADLPPEVRQNQVSGGNLIQRLAEVEKKMLLHALEEYGWVQTRVVESLGISEKVLR
ncbi:MAG: hypothetical protein KJ804_02010 [Proteobacteria bacterium]|nr:hypothetical protein [Pseudomonadota bacterium]MBU1057081.1 hypothetical protein [Pseudomonadota bacterium]